MNVVNLLTLTIGPCEDNATMGEGASFLVTAAVDGVPLPEWLDIDEFFRSLIPLREVALIRALCFLVGQRALRRG